MANLHTLHNEWVIKQAKPAAINNELRKNNTHTHKQQQQQTTHTLKRIIRYKVDFTTSFLFLVWGAVVLQVTFKPWKYHQIPKDCIQQLERF